MRSCGRRAACAPSVSTWRYFAGQLPPQAKEHHTKEDCWQTDLAMAGKTLSTKGDAPLDAARDASFISGKAPIVAWSLGGRRRITASS